MSPIPGQTLTIRDPGLGLVSPAGNAFVFLGASEKGTLNTVQSISSPAVAVDTFGEGPLSEALAYALLVGGGPQYAVRVTGTVAGATGAVTKTAIGTSTGTVAAAGAAYDTYDVIVEITKSGALGVAEFRFSLDGGRTYSEARTVPSGGTYAIPRTNVTLTFTAGAGPTILERGDKFTFTTTAPHYSSTELNAGIDAVQTYLSITPGLAIDAIVATGVNATGSAGATLFGAMATKLQGLANIHQYMRGMVDAGSRDTRTNVKTAFAAVADTRVMAVYGYMGLPSAKSYSGFGAPAMPLISAVAGRAVRARISVDLARTAGDGAEGGPIKGALSITHDEYVTEEMDAAKITTARTWPGVPGYFITNGNLKSAAGSDFAYWQHGRIMDVACRTVIAAQQQFMSSEFLTTAKGTLEEREAKRIEGIVSDKLREQLLDPVNASGRRGHVSEFRYAVDRTNNVLSTQELRSSVAIRPLGYPKWLRTEIGFALNVGATT